MRHPVTIQIEHATFTTTHVHVNVHVPKMATRLAWRSEGDDFPPIDTTDCVVRIPARYLKHSGLKPPSRADDLLLYKRRAMEQLWHAIQRDALQRSSVLSIVGGPGTGKSSGAYAFACGLVDRTKWIVVWLHFVPRGDGFLCVKLDGSTKTTAKWSPSSDHWDPLTLFGVAERETRDHETRGLMVFVDGYSEEEKTCVSTLNALKAWSWEDPVRHRLVCVASVASVAMWKRSIAIAHQAESMLLGSKDSEEVSTMEDMDESGADDNESDDEALFRLTSWRLEEYYQAVENDDLYGTVAKAMRSTLTTSGVSNDVVSNKARRTLVDIKYRLAGGSAALMFTLSPRQIVSVLERALSAVGSVRDLLSGSIPSSGMAHALLACYDGDGNATGTRPRLVSALAARLVAANVVPAAISEFELAFAVNPSVASPVQLLEPFFVASLASTGFTYRCRGDRSGMPDRWCRCPVQFFDPETKIVRLRDHWNVPTTWHPKGYDAIYMDADATPFNTASSDTRVKCSLEFVQLTRAATHSFRSKPFSTLLERLWFTSSAHSGEAEAALLNLYRVVLSYAVPLDRVVAFRPPVTAAQFRAEVLASVFPDTYTKIECSVRVMGLKGAPSEFDHMW